ncbi:MAG TPA: rhomboid family intramembrane serine protease, partial [Pseudobdellovibrionaceae bacterium]|jgi:membrane associated rhomboid family serine protease
MKMHSLVSWLSDDRIDKALKNTEFADSPSYQGYLKARETYLHRSLEQSREDLVFIRGNAKIMASLKALVTHEGWVHLIGNMLIFALFAIFVEQRIGFFGLILLYCIGGLGSNYLQLPFLPMGVRLFGASGAVSAVIGAFAVYFWREKMRCLLSVGFVYNRMILIPAWLYIGLFLLLSDVVGMTGVGSGVAHLAHFTGFLAGFIFAFMQMDLFPMKNNFLFPAESKLYYDAKETQVLEEKMDLFRRIYRLNRESFYSFRALFIYFEKHSCLLANFTEEDQTFLTDIVRSCILYPEQDEKYAIAREILEKIPLTWNLSSLDLRIGPEELIKRAEQFRLEGDLIQTLRFYDMFFAKFAVHPQAQDINSEIMKIFDQVEKFDLEIKIQILEALLVYNDNHPDTQFQTQIRQLIHQVHREEKNAS